MFDPTDSLEALGYDFTAYGGQKRVIPEPSEEQVTQFYASQLESARRSLARSEDAANVKPPKDESTEERDERLHREALEQASRSHANLQERREQLAALCSNTPSVEELAALPHRVFLAFEGYLIGKLSPEALRADTRVS